MTKKPRLTVVKPGASEIQPPRPLGQHGMALWGAVQREFAITDIGGLELLQQACAGIDRLEAITAQINAEGELIQTRTGMRSNPLIRDETQLRALVCRVLEKLGITHQAIKTPGRPGGFTSWTGEN